MAYCVTDIFTTIERHSDKSVVTEDVGQTLSKHHISIVLTFDGEVCFNGNYLFFFSGLSLINLHKITVDFVATLSDETCNAAIHPSFRMTPLCIHERIKHHLFTSRASKFICLYAQLDSKLDFSIESPLITSELCLRRLSL